MVNLVKWLTKVSKPEDVYFGVCSTQISEDANQSLFAQEMLMIVIASELIIGRSKLGELGEARRCVRLSFVFVCVVQRPTKVSNPEDVSVRVLLTSTYFVC